MSGQHTPWHVVPYGDGDSLVICLDEAGDKRVAFMATPGCRDQIERRKVWKQIKANARLIAQAPELLALAYQYQSDLRHPPTADSVTRRLERIAAVLAKAGVA